MTYLFPFSFSPGDTILQECAFILHGEATDSEVHNKWSLISICLEEKIQDKVLMNFAPGESKGIFPLEKKMIDMFCQKFTVSPSLVRRLATIVETNAIDMASHYGSEMGGFNTYGLYQAISKSNHTCQGFLRGQILFPTYPFIFITSPSFYDCLTFYAGPYSNSCIFCLGPNAALRFDPFRRGPPTLSLVAIKNIAPGDEVCRLYQASIYPSIYRSIYPSIDLSIHLSIHLSIYLSIYLSTHLGIARSGHTLR